MIPAWFWPLAVKQMPTCWPDLRQRVEDLAQPRTESALRHCMNHAFSPCGTAAVRLEIDSSGSGSHLAAEGRGRTFRDPKIGLMRVGHNGWPCIHPRRLEREERTQRIENGEQGGAAMDSARPCCTGPEPTSVLNRHLVDLGAVGQLQHHIHVAGVSENRVNSVEVWLASWQM